MADEHDPLEGLFEATPVEEAGDQPTQGQPEQVQQPTQEAPAGEQKDDQGGEPAKEPKMVPIEALHEARRRATDAEARLADRDPGKQQEADPLASGDVDLSQVFGDRPNPKEDLEGYLAWNEGVQQFNQLNTNLNFSERMARKEHGDEITNTVKDWAQKRFHEDPAFAQRVLFDTDPYEVAIREYNKLQETQRLQDLPEEVRQGLDADELELIRQHRASKPPGSGQSAEAQQHQQPTRAANGQFQPARRSPSAPASSIASSPSGGKKSNTDIAAGQGVAFDTAFGT